MTQDLKPSFTLREIKDQALALTKKHWAHYVLIGIIALVVIAPFELVRTVIEIDGSFELRDTMSAFEQGYGPVVISAILGIVSMLVQLYFAVVMTRYALAAAEDRSPGLKEYFPFDGKTLIAALGATILYILAVMGGLLLLVIPGVIFAIAFSMYLYPLVEKNQGAWISLQQSWRMTRGNRGRIFLFGLLVALAGLALIVIPLAIALAPVAMQLENGLLFTVILAILAVAWGVVVSIGLGAFNMISSALMYKKMMATRNVNA